MFTCSTPGGTRPSRPRPSTARTASARPSTSSPTGSICRGTVEEKILELQQKKRDLADAILNADNRGVIQNLTREDLEFLLS